MFFVIAHKKTSTETFKNPSFSIEKTQNKDFKDLIRNVK